MIITHVTFDGVDENLSPDSLLRLRKEYGANIQFSIQLREQNISLLSQVEPQLPGTQWVSKVQSQFLEQAHRGLTLHLRGEPMREFIQGSDFPESDSIRLENFDRLKLGLRSRDFNNINPSHIRSFFQTKKPHLTAALSYNRKGEIPFSFAVDQLWAHSSGLAPEIIFKQTKGSFEVPTFIASQFCPNSMQLEVKNLDKNLKTMDRCIGEDEPTAIHLKQADGKSWSELDIRNAMCSTRRFLPEKYAVSVARPGDKIDPRTAIAKSLVGA
jgi:hypothetical protein